MDNFDFDVLTGPSGPDQPRPQPKRVAPPPAAPLTGPIATPTLNERSFVHE
jgi:hypothetical protein